MLLLTDLLLTLCLKYGKIAKQGGNLLGKPKSFYRKLAVLPFAVAITVPAVQYMANAGPLSANTPVGVFNAIKVALQHAAPISWLTYYAWAFLLSAIGKLQMLITGRAQKAWISIAATVAWAFFFAHTVNLLWGRNVNAILFMTLFIPQLTAAVIDCIFSFRRGS